jgi:hypothetical protein
VPISESCCTAPRHSPHRPWAEVSQRAETPVARQVRHPIRPERRGRDRPQASDTGTIAHVGGYLECVVPSLLAGVVVCSGSVLRVYDARRIRPVGQVSEEIVRLAQSRMTRRYRSFDVGVVGVSLARSSIASASVG